MKVTKHDIGGELISIITKGMYADPLDALREYVQNGVDALAENISIRIKHNSIIVADDGSGMDKIVMRKAVRVGISDKNPKRSVGFMGIGLYSSFHLCDTLNIYSKVENESPYKLSFHFDKMRDYLENQKDLRILGNIEQSQQIDLQTLLANNIEFTELEDFNFPNKGTRIEMIGLETNFFKTLSRFDEVSEYLERVIPLPFSPEFKYGEKIQNKITEVCKKYDTKFRTINLTLDINGYEQLLYRPYKDLDFHDKKPLAPKFIELVSADGFLGLAWGCLNSGRSIISNGKIRGFIIKKQGFTIGKREDLLIHFGRATFFNRYVGEFIALHPKLFPNAPRSDFEYSNVRTTFYAVLKETAYEFNKIANDFQEEAKAEADLSHAIDRYNEITAQLNFFQENGDKLLEYFQELNSIQLSLTKKADAEKFKAQNLTKAKETLKKINSLLDEIKLLLDIKKSKKKKGIKKPVALKDKIITPLQAKENEPTAKNLIETIELMGLEISPDLKSILELIDEKFIKSASLNKEDYLSRLLELRNDIETLYESE